MLSSDMGIATLFFAVQLQLNYKEIFDLNKKRSQPSLKQFQNPKDLFLTNKPNFIVENPGIHDFCRLK